MSTPRITVIAQVHPNVAAAVRRGDVGWIIAVNPGLPARERYIAEAEAQQFVDGFEMGWSYRCPEAGVDVVETAFMAVAAVADARLAG